MPKNKYTPQFETFWKVYPRKTAKIVAFKAWVKHGIDNDAFLPKQIGQDVEKRIRLKWFSNDHEKVPHAATGINQARWEDEGWEDEIKTRNGKHNTVTPVYQPIEDDGPHLSPWQMMLNRLMRNYIFLCRGVPDLTLASLVKTKNEVLTEIEPAATEEINAASDEDAMRDEMAFLFADTMLSRFDLITGKTLKGRVINMARRVNA